MAAKTAPHAPTGTYLELVKRFPLTRIRDDGHLDATQRVIDRLLEKDLDEGARDGLDALTALVEDYENNHISIPDASEADVLRELMRSNDFSPPSLAKRVGIAQSTISAVLNGNRTLTKGEMVKLARFFGVSPATFLPA